VKTPEQVITDVVRRLHNTWHLAAAGTEEPEPRWPHTFPLGTAPKGTLEANFQQAQQAAFGLRDWAATHRVTLTDVSRLVHGTTQRIPTHVTVATIDDAARLCGPEWKSRLERGRARAAALTERFGPVSDLPRILREIDNYTDVDFELLCVTAQWFGEHSAAGLTPRQVPIPGLHAKWLNSHHATVANLAGLADLELRPRHPARLHFTYLDPDHRTAGRRRHDSATVGDAVSLAYLPSAVVISENKDTALHFPELPGGISVEGAGHGAATAASFAWLRDCPNLFYWGDLDVAGFEILNGFRDAGLAVTSILMDLTTYERYEQFGTSTDAHGNPLKPLARRPLLRLTDSEQQLYECLTDPAWTRYRRVEQERIPLSVAAAAVQQRVT
jgi:hypothetical protein